MNEKQYNNGERNEDMSKRKNGRRSNGLGGLKLHGNTWYARYTDALGVRREISTHTSNREEALKVLATYTNPIRESKSDEEIKLRLQQSIDVLELRKDVSKIERLKLDDLIEKFLNHRDLADTAKSTKKGYGYHLECLLKVINEKFPNAKYVDDVTQSVVDGIMDDLTKHYTAMTFNLALNTYKRVWGMFSRSNPFLKVSKRRIDKSRHRIAIDENDMRRIMAACRDDVERAIWGVGAYTGLRCGDVCTLKYGNLSRDLSTITITPQKTRKHMPDPIVIPVCPTLKGLLMRVVELNKVGNDAHKEDFVFEVWAYRYNHNCVTDRFRYTLEKAGLKVSHTDEQGHKQIDTGFHICRHFFISVASRYMSPLLVQKIVGHSAISMTAHYYHSNQAEILEGISAMPNITNDETHENAPVKSQSEEVMDLLNQLKKGEETPLETLKRLMASSIKMAS